MGPDGNLVLTKETSPNSTKVQHQVLCLEDGTETNSTVLIYEKRLSDHVVFILTTHLKASEECKDIRRQQASHLIKIIDQLKRSSNSNSRSGRYYCET